MNENTIKEKYLNNSINPISIKGMEKITFQLKNCVCKIRKKDNVKATGFFCKIPYQNYNNLLTVLFTNNHVLNQNDLIINNKIDITINDDNEIRSIIIDNSRKFFTDPDLDVTIIEIKPNIDKINKFLELDEKIFKEKNLVETLFKKRFGYVLHYPKGENVVASFGQIIKLEDQKINHLCSTDKGSSGSPILDLDSFKVIGIHYGSSDNFQFNKGIFMKNIVFKFNNFMQKGKINKSNLNNINESIKTYNVSFKISQEIIYKEKIECNIEMRSLLSYFIRIIFQKFKSTNMMNMGMPSMMGMGMIAPFPPLNIQFYYNGLNINYDEDKNTVEYYFKNDFNPIIFVSYNNIDYYMTIIKFIFKDNHGNQFEIFGQNNLYPYMSIKSLVKIYLHEFGLKKYNSLIDSDFENPLAHWGIQLLYNNKNIEYEYIDNYGFKTDTPIEAYFNIDYTKIKNEFYIYVNDINNIIKTYTFKDNHGVKVEIIFNKKKTIKELIKKYLKKVNHSELTDIERKDEIQFIYNQKKLECDDNTKIENYFNIENNPIIQVNDFDGLLITEPIKEYNITFKTSLGYKYILDFSVGSKIERIIYEYLYYIDHPELINNRNNIKFLYNGEIINEKITARKCFKNETEPIIFVLDTNNLLTNAAKYNDNNKIISGKFNVIFKAENGTTNTSICNYGATIDKILKKYLLKIDHPELINSNKISFSFCGDARQLKFGDQTVGEEFFNNSANPTILVYGL